MPLKESSLKTGPKSISLGPDRYPSNSAQRQGGGIVHVNGADCDEEFLRLLAMIQTLSQARDAYELFELAARYTSDGPIGGEAHAIVVVSTEGAQPGEYAITRKLLSVPRRRQSIEVADSNEQAVMHQTGFISSILRKRQPELLSGIDLTPDVVLGEDFSSFDSCLFVPLFSGGRMTKRVLFFRRGWDEVDFDHVERVMLIMNLIETAIESINHAHRSSELSSLLDKNPNPASSAIAHFILGLYFEKDAAGKWRLKPGLTKRDGQESAGEDSLEQRAEAWAAFLEQEAAEA